MILFSLWQFSDFYTFLYGSTYIHPNHQQRVYSTLPIPNEIKTYNSIVRKYPRDTKNQYQDKDIQTIMAEPMVILYPTTCLILSAIFLVFRNRASIIYYLTRCAQWFDSENHYVGLHIQTDDTECDSEPDYEPNPEDLENQWYAPPPLKPIPTTIKKKPSPESHYTRINKGKKKKNQQKCTVPPHHPQATTTTTPPPPPTHHQYQPTIRASPHQAPEPRWRGISIRRRGKSTRRCWSRRRRRGKWS